MNKIKELEESIVSLEESIGLLRQMVFQHADILQKLGENQGVITEILDSQSHGKVTK